MHGFEQPSEMTFNNVRFWMKAYDLPMKKKTYELTGTIASKFDVRRGMMVNVRGVPKW